MHDLLGDLEGSARAAQASLLAAALAVAAVAHRDDYDAAGVPMLLHVERVAARLAQRQPYYDERLVVIGLLHDAVESGGARFERRGTANDPIIIAEDVACPLTSRIVSAIDALNRPRHFPYARYIEALASDELAVEVKLADLEDNLDGQRMKRLPAEFRAKHQKRYLAAHKYLMEVRTSRRKWLRGMG